MVKETVEILIDGGKATPPESDGDEKDGEITSRYPQFICCLFCAY